ncbi:MAG: molybdopterin molybdotransferase MoeA [Deltaproteobacteria bacterium]|nr:molybdopterin molybdotransferase MoeA [Deltaproteobacteria bacterium]
MITVAEAIEQILQTINPLGLERVNILDALGRVLGEDITAGRNIPPKDNSAMDGYALRFQDTIGASPHHPVVLEVIEDIPAGAIPQKSIAAGQSARIMTGAPLPVGADAVLKMEDTEKDGQKIRIMAEAQSGQDIRRAGEDVREGELVIPRGTSVRPAGIGMLASLGRSFVSVYQRPLIAVLATGNELLDIDESPSPWKIINSNSYSLASQALDCGALVMQMGIAKDKREDLLARFQAAMRADVIISSGGVSVGDYDLVKDIMQEVGSRMQFWQVAMRPGKPLAFGRIGNVPMFGLPGNPVSSMISFEQFIRPAILKMMGHQEIFRKTVRAVLQEDIEKRKGFTHFIRALVKAGAGGYTVSTTGEQGSGILKSMVRANGLIVLPENTEKVKAGTEVKVQMLDNSLSWTSQPEYL